MSIEGPPGNALTPTKNEGPLAPNWPRWRDIPLTILAWFLVIFVVLQAAGRVIGTLLVIAVAVLLAYGLLPLVRVLARTLPRPLAIAIVYLFFFGALSAVIYFIVNTAVGQVVAVAQNVQGLLNGADPNSGLLQFLGNFGITTAQLQQFGHQILSQAKNIAGAIVPILGDILGVVVDFVVITVLSIYFVANGPRVDHWLRGGVPLRYRARTQFALDTFSRVVGGYIRGQVTLALLVGVLVGVGMYVLQVPYAILLGVLAFVLEFIPFLGVLASGAACVLVGVTVGPITALLVLAVFVVVHVIEGDVVGPRIVGNAVGLHPVVSLIALIAGTELFGVFGALFAAPVAGVLQALAISVWRAWRDGHPEEFPTGHTITYDVPIVPTTTDKANQVVIALDLTPGPHPPTPSPAGRGGEESREGGGYG